MSSTQIIDGKSIADRLLLEVQQEVNLLKNKNISPCLAVVMVGNDPISTIYVNKKIEIAKKIGVKSISLNLDKNISTTDLVKKITSLNQDISIHGILVQLPLPKHIEPDYIINSINPKKDVDGFTVQNIGKLILEHNDAILPCTPQGCLHLIKSVESNIAGMHAVVVGRSNIVGRPISNILLNENCTVTTMHIHTKNKAYIAKQADILVVATGHSLLVTKEWVKKDAIVIDVGISHKNINGINKLVGDVDFDHVKDKVRAITPVPGGVGPMTVAYLMKNTVKAALISSCNSKLC